MSRARASDTLGKNATLPAPALPSARSGLLQRKCACAGTAGVEGPCDDCRKNELSVQRLAAEFGPAVAPPIVRDVLNSPGQPLDAASRADMEPRFGHDFSKVRVHTDAKAADSARAVGALAYTVGQHVVFAAGHYHPRSDRGRGLLAHELTHTLQQSSGDHHIPDALPITTPADASEQAADRTADAILKGGNFTPGAGSRPELAREDAGEDPEHWRQNTLADFCTPYTSAFDKSQAQKFMKELFVPLLGIQFGPDVADLWMSYLNRRRGASMTPRVFRDPSGVVNGAGRAKGFANSETTQQHQDQYVRNLISGFTNSCPALPANKPVTLPVSQFLPATDLNDPINFDRKFEIPGNIAGGISGIPAWPDLRRISGEATFLRSTDAAGVTNNIRLTAVFHYMVQDAVDFCPGGIGGLLDEANFTIPLSRLEASNLAFTVPFQVFFDGPPVALDLDPVEVKACYPDAVVAAPVAPSPITPEPNPPAPAKPAPPSDDRRFWE